MKEIFLMGILPLGIIMLNWHTIFGGKVGEE